MATIKEFEKLGVWKAARVLNNLIYKLTKLPDFSKDFALRDQVRRASISAMSNIAEGLTPGFDAEFIRFLSYSYRSVAEVQSQLYTALGENYMDQGTFRKAYDQADEVRRQLHGLMSYLSNNKRTGRRIGEVQPEYAVYNPNEQIDLPPEFQSSD